MNSEEPNWTAESVQSLITLGGTELVAKLYNSHVTLLGNALKLYNDMLEDGFLIRSEPEVKKGIKNLIDTHSP